MSQTDPVPPEFFFAELLLPLRHAVARRNIHYLKLDREPKSYWRPVASRTGGLERLCAAECAGDELLARLGQYWAARGDAYLPKLLPYLIALRRDLVNARPVGVEHQPELDDFVYPLF
jgi:hypothetical protein